MTNTPADKQTISYDTESDINAFSADMARFTAARFSRRDTRTLIFHLLYAAESFRYEESLEAIAYNLRRGLNVAITNGTESFLTAQAIVNQRDELDRVYQPFLNNWRLERISIATKLIMRLAAWEMVHTAVDRKIVMNEAIELAKDFAEQDAFRFVNGILDRMAKELPLMPQEETSNPDTTIPTPSIGTEHIMPAHAACVSCPCP